MTITPNSHLAQIIEALGLLDCDTLNTVLNNMSAANYASLEWITLSTDTQISSMLANHIYSLRCTVPCNTQKKTSFWITDVSNNQNTSDCFDQCGTHKKTSFWINGIGEFYNEDAFDCLNGFDANTAGVIIGVDKCHQHFYFGFGGGYTYTDFDIKGSAGFGHIHSGFGALYGSFVSKYFATNASVIAGAKFFDMRRKIAFLMIDEIASSTFDSSFINTHLGAMLQGYMKDFRLEAFGDIDYHYLYLNPILETGTPIRLLISQHYSHFLKLEFGITVKGVFKRKNACYIPFLGLSEVRKIPLGRTNYDANFSTSTFCMDTCTSDSTQTLISPKLGFRIHAQSFILTFGYKGEFNRYTQDHQFDGRFEWIF